MLLINNGVCPIGEEMDANFLDFKIPSDESDVNIGDRVVFFNLKTKDIESGFVSEILDSGLLVINESNENIFFENDEIYSYISSDYEYEEYPYKPEIFPGKDR